MKPRFVDIDGQLLAYFEGEAADTSRSKAVFFLHGNSISSSVFLRQMESPLRKQFRLIMLDLPGHGMSPPASDPRIIYSMPGLAEIVRKFVDMLGLADAFFVGWSLGANILVEVIAQSKFASGIILIGPLLPAKPLDIPRMAFPNPALASLFKGELSANEINTWATALLRPDAVPPPFLGEEIRKSDARFRTVLGETLAQGLYQDEVAIVARLSKPLMVVLGAQDQLCRQSYLRSLPMPSLWRGDLKIIPDAGHLPQWEQSEKFNALLTNFLAGEH